MNEIIDYVMNSPENTNPNVLKGLLESFASGSGDSDFSTAEVKVINSTESRHEFGCPNIYTEGSTEALVMDASVGKNAETTITAVLYKGEGELFLYTAGASMTATGDIEITGHDAIISGDGTITLSALQGGLINA